MTGHGAAQVERDQVRVQAEIRSVNNKHLKVSLGSELSAETQAKVEQLVRDSVARGSVYVRLQVENQDDTGYRLNIDNLLAYRRQLESAGEANVALQALLGLPGIVNSSGGTVDSENVADAVCAAVREALENLNRMRQDEGQAMLQNMVESLTQFNLLVSRIETQSPRVVELFSNRLTERINQLLSKHDIQVQPTDVIREIGIFAERADIHEELVRLSSHLNQFRESLESPTSEGRKLDFLIQELLRETNTIGSKANDAEISSCVVEMKSIIERMRELVQNVQ